MRINELLTEDSVEDLEKDLRHPYSYDAIDHMMKAIAKKYKITPKELHNLFVKKHGMVPDNWIKDADK
jgi:methylphosphotriester-DNA--protein-cysteine methyltransferase